MPESRLLFDILKIEPGEDFVWSSFARCEAKDICARVRSLYALGWDDISIRVQPAVYPAKDLDSWYSAWAIIDRELEDLNGDTQLQLTFAPAKER